MYIHRILEEREHIPSSDKVIGEALLTEMTSTPSSTSMSSERLKNLIKTPLILSLRYQTVLRVAVTTINSRWGGVNSGLHAAATCNTVSSISFLEHVSKGFLVYIDQCKMLGRL